MSLRNTTERWGWLSQALHWLIAVLILCMATVGLLLDDLPKSPKYFWVFDLHKSTGLTVLVLVVLRLGWRLYAGKPEPVAGTPTWQKRAADVTHWLLYGVMLTMPLSGWLYDSASGLRPLRWFGLFSVPKLSAPDPELKSLALGIHEYGFWVLATLVLLHAGAALWHHLVQRDATLERMLPRAFAATKKEESAA